MGLGIIGWLVIGIVAGWLAEKVMGRNHGLLTCGETVGAAFMRMYYLERACKVQLQAMSTGQALDLPSAELCERAAQQLGRFPSGQYEWPALLRLVETKFPEFRQ